MSETEHDREKSKYVSRRLQLTGRLGSSPSKIWKSRLSWRVAMAVFLTIMMVQAGILALTIKEEEFKLLTEITDLGHAAIKPLANPNSLDFLNPAIDEQGLRKAIASKIILGAAIYGIENIRTSEAASDVRSNSIFLLKTYGAAPDMVVVDRDSLTKTYRSANGNFYEVIYTLSGNQYLVARLDASHVGKAVFSYLENTILIMLLMSAFVTVVLMIAIGHWLLEPLLFLRENLLIASENPENPGIHDSPFDPNDEIGGAIIVAHRLILQNADNIRQIKSAAEDKIHKLAYYDTLTGLPNRTLFLQKLNEQAKSQRGEKDPEHFAVIALDLDHFKDVNDTMGHNVGDAILRGVSKRLRSALPDDAIVARSGEDEFAITMPLNSDIPSAKDLAQKVSQVIRSEPFKAFNENFQIRASIGAATFPDDGIDPDQVLKNADIALNRAKEEGRDTYKEYSEDYDREVQQRFQMLRDLRDALDHKQLDLFYQPQFDLSTGKLIGAEALLRWFKPDNSKEGGKFISPAEFIPVAESSGLIVPIGEWVMHKACTMAADFQKNGGELRIAVNVSGAQFYQSDLVEFTQKVLGETGLKASNLELEVTESVFMDDIQHAIDTLRNLHSLGVELAIDDFGTGYSSLSYLRQFPIDRLKIDQSFIRNALNNADDASIAKTIITLGHSLNLKVIAEGVETIEHETFLREQTCDEVQGFRYSRPVPEEEFRKFVATYTGDLSSFDKNA